MEASAERPVTPEKVIFGEKKNWKFVLEKFSQFSQIGVCFNKSLIDYYKEKSYVRG